MPYWHTVLFLENIFNTETGSYSGKQHVYHFHFSRTTSFSIHNRTSKLPLFRHHIQFFTILNDKTVSNKILSDKMRLDKILSDKNKLTFSVPAWFPVFRTRTIQPTFHIFSIHRYLKLG
jgi:hypothetical protein